MNDTQTVDTLVLDLLEWIGPGSRPYAEVLEAWRTSCPRLAVWEEAHLRGFLSRYRGEAGIMLAVSAAGAAHLRSRRPSADLERPGRTAVS